MRQLPFDSMLTVAPSVEKIEETISNVGLAAAVGGPGYLLHGDIQGHLFINNSSDILSINISPEWSLSVRPSGRYGDRWTVLDISAAAGAFGRSRIYLTYEKGDRHTAHYFTTENGRNLWLGLEKSWWNSNGLTIISYDHSVDGHVLQDNRAWIAVVSDDGGAGLFEATTMKQNIQSVASEVVNLEKFVHTTTWARLQLTDGSKKHGVRKSLLFYQPDAAQTMTMILTLTRICLQGQIWSRERENICRFKYYQCNSAARPATQHISDLVSVLLHTRTCYPLLR